MEQSVNDFTVGALKFVAIGLVILGNQHCKPVHNANASLAQFLEAWQLVPKALTRQLNRAVLILMHLQRGKQRVKLDYFQCLFRVALLLAIADQSADFSQSLIDLFSFFCDIGELLQA